MHLQQSSKLKKKTNKPEKYQKTKTKTKRTQQNKTKENKKKFLNMSGYF